LLSAFGGQIEEGESPEAAALRELQEETSIRYPVLILPIGVMERDSTVYHMFQATIRDDDFEVYEGAGKEVHSVTAALALTDLAEPARFALTRHAREDKGEA
jgi:8-oxo-dGTP pyrophosphatase MutT (NUDIX family)